MNYLVFGKNVVEDHLPKIETGIPILLEIDPTVDVEFLRGLGFEIICELPEGFIIVATEDIDLTILNEKTDAFIANITARCNSPAKVYALCEETDRLKRVLSKDLYEKWHTIVQEMIYIVDVGMSCCGSIELPERPKRNDNETDAMTHWKHNTEFHLRLISISHNHFIVEQLENCMGRLKWAYSQYYWKKEKEILFSMDTAHHVDIVSALHKGDVEQAVKFLEEDLKDFGEYSGYRNNLHFPK